MVPEGVRGGNTSNPERTSEVGLHQGLEVTESIGADISPRDEIDEEDEQGKYGETAATDRECHQ